MLVADGLDLFHLAGCAVEVCNDDEFCVRIDLEGLFEGFRAHIPGVALGVDEDSLAVLVGDRVDAGVKCAVRAEHAVALEGAFIGACLAIELLAGELGREVERGGAAGKGDGVAHADVVGDELFGFVDVRADGGDPVGADGFVDPVLLVAVHGWGGEPDLVVEGVDAGGVFGGGHRVLLIVVASSSVRDGSHRPPKAASQEPSPGFSLSGTVPTGRLQRPPRNRPRGWGGLPGTVPGVGAASQEPSPGVFSQWWPAPWSSSVGW